MFLGLSQDFSADFIYPLPQFNNRRMIVNKTQFGMLSNICPHQNAMIVKRPVSELQCPYHGLHFDCKGYGINNSYQLQEWPVYQSQTILFDRPIEKFPIDTSYMRLQEYRIDSVPACVNVILDVFIDIDHIPVAHPGVYDKVGIQNIDKLTWTTFSYGSLQWVPAQNDNHMIDQDKIYNLGAVWMAVYPGTMIEWQPGAMFVTVAIADDKSSKVCVFKYKDRRYDESSWQLNNHIWETAWAQDRVLAECIDSLASQNLDALKLHHRDWLNHVLQE